MAFIIKYSHGRTEIIHLQIKWHALGKALTLQVEYSHEIKDKDEHASFLSCKCSTKKVNI